MNTKPTTVKEVLEKARDLISDPKYWTQKYFAVRADNEIIGSCMEGAVAWCASGAINKTCATTEGALQAGAISALMEVMGEIPDFNDNSPYEDVLAAFDIAICLES